MAKIRNTASAYRVGRVGNTTYYVARREQIARVSQNSSNYGETARRSIAQQTRRVQWANLVNTWRAFTPYLTGAFEAKSSNQTDFNAFVSANLLDVARLPVYLTKEEAASGLAVPLKIILSSGSLTPLKEVKTTDNTHAVWDNVIMFAAESVASWSARLIADNDFPFQYGDQISMFAFNNTTNILKHLEITLSADDTRDVDALFDNFYDDYDPSMAHLNLGLLEHTYVACIISRKCDNEIKVTKSRMLSKEENDVADYTTDKAKEYAIKSYGYDQDIFLNPGDMTVIGD